MRRSPPNKPDDGSSPDDEAFFSRWSRRKSQAKRPEALPADPPAPLRAPMTHARDTQARDVAPGSDGNGPGAAATHNSAGEPTHATPAPRALTEDDFRDVDFTKLDYGSDYSRFTASGVPESIRQRALTQLWHSDTVFTQVDPFQDYAGDFTDAATVPKGIVQTGYRVGQGFLSDDEAHAWDRLGKPDIAPDLAALPVLRPGYRVRAATLDDSDAMAALQVAAILATSSGVYGDDVARSWAEGLTGAVIAGHMRGGAVGEVVFDETDGKMVGMLGRLGCSIEALFVAPTHGRRGIARQLIARTVRALEAPEARLPITASASRLSRPLFERLGWRLVSARGHETRGGLSLEVFDMARPVITTATFAIASETPDQAEVHAFFAASEAYMGALYPAESNHFVDVVALAAPDATFLIARLDGVAVGCGAVVADGQGAGEIKRMWVAPEMRGLRVGVRLLAALEKAGRSAGVSVLRLETGIHQPEAISLYRRAGFVEIAAFGAYRPDPLSLFMEKPLVVATTIPPQPAV